MTEDVKVENVTITLAKANKLRGLIDKAINEYTSKMRTKIQTPINLMGLNLIKFGKLADERKAEVTSLYSTIVILTSINTDLRNRIGIANAHSGITAIMGEIEKHRKLSSIITSAYNLHGNLLDHNTIQTLIYRANPEEQNTVGSYNSSIIPITQADADAEREAAKSFAFAISELEDRRNLLNYENKLEMKADTMELLKTLKIIGANF